MHPLVRDLYKRVLIVGKDYPLGLDYVKKQWKIALQDPKNCPNAYDSKTGKPLCGLGGNDVPLVVEKEIRKAVGKGRFWIREMIGIIQLKKYRTINQRYNSNNNNNDSIQERIDYQQFQQEEEEEVTATTGKKKEGFGEGGGRL